MMKRLLALILSLLIVFPPAVTAQSGAPSSFPSVNLIYYVGTVTGWYPTVQSAVTASCAAHSGFGTVVIEQGVTPSGAPTIGGQTTYSVNGCANTFIRDERGGGGASCYTYTNGTTYNYASCFTTTNTFIKNPTGSQVGVQPSGTVAEVTGGWTNTNGIAGHYLPVQTGSVVPFASRSPINVGFGIYPYAFVLEQDPNPSKIVTLDMSGGDQNPQTGPTVAGTPVSVAVQYANGMVVDTYNGVTHIYVGSFDTGTVYAYNVSSSGTVTLAGSVAGIPSTQRIGAVLHPSSTVTKLYLADQTDGRYYAVDVSNPASPSIDGYADASLGAASALGLCATGKYVYGLTGPVSGTGFLDVYAAASISGNHAQAKVASVSIKHAPQGCDVYGKWIAITFFDTSEVGFIDTSNLSAAVVYNVLPGGAGGPIPIRFQGDSLFVGAWGSGAVLQFSATNLPTLTQIGTTISIASPQTLDVRGRNLLIGSSSNVAYRFDIGGTVVQQVAASSVATDVLDAKQARMQSAQVDGPVTAQTINGQIVPPQIASASTPPWAQNLGDGSDGANTTASGNMSGGFYYTDFTVPAGNVVTVNATTGLFIHATGTCTIAGTINARGIATEVNGSGAGFAGGSGGGGGAGSGNVGNNGSQTNIPLATTGAPSTTTLFAGGVGGTLAPTPGSTGNAVTIANMLATAAINPYYFRGFIYKGGFNLDPNQGLGGTGGSGGSTGAAGGRSGGTVGLVCGRIVGTDGTTQGIIDVSGGPPTLNPAGTGGGAGGGGGAGVIFLSSQQPIQTSPKLYTVGGAGGIINGGAQVYSMGGSCTTSAAATVPIVAGQVSGTVTVVRAGAGCGTGTDIKWVFGGGSAGTAVFTPTFSGGALTGGTVTPGTSTGFATYVVSGSPSNGGDGGAGYTQTWQGW